MASTYTPIATTTLGSSAASYTFSSIPSTYTDLILVTNFSSSVTGTDLCVQLNGDTANNYSYRWIDGTGSAAASAGVSTQPVFKLNHYGYGTTTAGETNNIAHFQNYSNTTTYKTILSRANSSSNGVSGVASLWRSTAAISSIKILTNDGSTYSTGTTFTLYGIAAA